MQHEADERLDPPWGRHQRAFSSRTRDIGHGPPVGAEWGKPGDGRRAWAVRSPGQAAAALFAAS